MATLYTLDDGTVIDDAVYYTKSPEQQAKEEEAARQQLAEERNKLIDEICDEVCKRLRAREEVDKHEYSS